MLIKMAYGWVDKMLANKYDINDIWMSWQNIGELINVDKLTYNDELPYGWNDRGWWTNILMNWQILTSKIILNK